MNPALAKASRNERRVLLSDERKRRASGDWGPWETIDLPNGTGGGGWNRNVRHAYRNKVFCVLSRSTSGMAIHLAIASLSGERPTWWEAQRIKNDLAGEDATAVEVYPPQTEVVDEADMYHLWVLPEPLPFSIYRDRK